MSRPPLSLDPSDPGAVPYFNWDVPVTNAELRTRLHQGPLGERLPWMARVLREARYDDVWTYLSLRRDVLPNWEQLRPRLGRRRRFWTFLIAAWRRAGLIE